jgi:hypothetical protein
MIVPAHSILKLAALSLTTLAKFDARNHLDQGWRRKGANFGEVTDPAVGIDRGQRRCGADLYLWRMSVRR